MKGDKGRTQQPMLGDKSRGMKETRPEVADTAIDAGRQIEGREAWPKEADAAVDAGRQENTGVVRIDRLI